MRVNGSFSHIEAAVKVYRGGITRYKLKYLDGVFEIRILKQQTPLVMPTWMACALTLQQVGPT